jgi:transposase InsO family protein
VAAPYTCEDYQTYLASHGIACSMSRRADCYDNAVMEAFFSTVKREGGRALPELQRRKNGPLKTDRLRDQGAISVAIDDVETSASRREHRGERVEPRAHLAICGSDRLLD